MANVTFSSPAMARDDTVYAVAGDRGAILAITEANKIPIPLDCQDGECGSCLIEVKHLDPHARYAIALTEKEKEMLKHLGKITKKEIIDAEVNDMPGIASPASVSCAMKTSSRRSRATRRCRPSRRT